jgi:hypothetical protein
MSYSDTPSDYSEPEAPPPRPATQLPVTRAPSYSDTYSDSEDDAASGSHSSVCMAFDYSSDTNADADAVVLGAVAEEEEDEDEDEDVDWDEVDAVVVPPVDETTASIVRQHMTTNTLTAQYAHFLAPARDRGPPSFAGRDPFVRLRALLVAHGEAVQRVEKQVVGITISVSGTIAADANALRACIVDGQGGPPLGNTRKRTSASIRSRDHQLHAVLRWCVDAMAAWPRAAREAMDDLYAARRERDALVSEMGYKMATARAGTAPMAFDTTTTPEDADAGRQCALAVTDDPLSVTATAEILSTAEAEAHSTMRALEAAVQTLETPGAPRLAPIATGGKNSWHGLDAVDPATAYTMHAALAEACKACLLPNSMRAMRTLRAAYSTQNDRADGAMCGRVSWLSTNSAYRDEYM